MDFAVDINIAVYNHARFLRRTLDSVLAQKTSFPVRIIAGDDCSTDGSREILKEYEQKYPGKFANVYHPTNIGLRVAERNGIIILRKSTAKYVALLDGDDYWTDPLKLQKQFDFMEANPDYAMCFHDCEIRTEDGKLIDVFSNKYKDRYAHQSFQYGDIVRYKVLAATSSYFFINPNPLADWVPAIAGGDAALLLWIATKGKIRYLPDVMSVYHYHNTGAESVYYDDPIAKSDRNIGEDRIFVNVIEPYYRPLIWKRIMWNRFYRIAKGITIGRMLHVPADLVRLAGDTVNWSWFSVLRFLRLTKPAGTR